jgi:[ribosomal protein S5]-alanine N-acetyltransferase
MSPSDDLDVDLVVPGRRDEEEFLGLIKSSVALHHKWVHPPDDSEGYGLYLKRISSQNHRGFVARERTTGTMVGVVNINDIRFGSMLSASLGYYAFDNTRAKGLMTQAVGLAVGRAFGEVGLHRVEANIQPDNLRSKALVQRLGFRLEGFSPRYLYVAGDWRDHERWAVLREEWVTPGAGALP